MEGIRQDDGSLAEVIKVKETAERLANGDSQEGGDQIRVVAGLVHQLAEQVERLARRPMEHGPTAPLSDTVDDA